MGDIFNLPEYSIQYLVINQLGKKFASAAKCFLKKPSPISNSILSNDKRSRSSLISNAKKEKKMLMKSEFPILTELIFNCMENSTSSLINSFDLGSSGRKPRGNMQNSHANPTLNIRQ